MECLKLYTLYISGHCEDILKLLLMRLYCVIPDSFNVSLLTALTFQTPPRYSEIAFNVSMSLQRALIRMPFSDTSQGILTFGASVQF